jgi:hypothetical protein
MLGRWLLMRAGIGTEIPDRPAPQEVWPQEAIRRNLAFGLSEKARLNAVTCATYISPIDHDRFRD